MWVSRYVVWLIVFAFFGWVWESIYCSIVDQKWANRGFLYGPLCPIYGFGFIGIVFAWQLVLGAGLSPTPLQIFSVVAAGSALLEYVTSWVLEALFHARWWDYKDMPLNLNGRICLPATVLFGLAGLFVVNVLYEPTMELSDSVPPEAMEAIALVLVALVSVDTTLTVSALTRFAQAAAQISENVNDRMSKLVDSAVEKSSEKADVLRRERERLEAQARQSSIGHMSVVVRGAARRIRSFSPVQQASAPVRQLEALWKDLRRS